MSDVMTYKQRRLCVEYAKTGDKTKAAMAAGYSKTTIDKGLSKIFNAPLVKEYTEKMNRHLSRTMKLTREWKLKKLELVIERSIPDELDDNIYSELYAPKVGLSAISEANKMQGHYEDKEEVPDEKVREAKEILNKYIEQHKQEY